MELFLTNPTVQYHRPTEISASKPFADDQQPKQICDKYKYTSKQKTTNKQTKMSVVIHRGIKAPAHKSVEPVGEAHYDLITALVTGVFVQANDNNTNSSASSTSSSHTPRKELLTAEVWGFGGGCVFL